MIRKKWKKALAVLLAAAAVLGCGQGTVKAEDPEEEAKKAYELPVQSDETKEWPQGPKVYGQSAILIDADTGAILYEKNMDDRHYPASITKILTALLAVENADLNVDKVLFTKESVDFLEPGDAYIAMRPGEEITLKDAMYGMLLASANEVSYAIAENVGNKLPGDGTGYEKFMVRMNERAKELGAKNTHFVNANGLYADDHYTTARDMALIAQAAFQNETFRNIIKTPYYIIPPTNITAEERWINNHHQMIQEGEHYYEGCLGGKTGYTVKAGNTLVTYAERNSMRLVCVVLKGTTEYYNDTKNLLDYGFNNFEKLKLSSEILAESDSLASYLKDQGLLDAAVENSSADVPVNPSQDITCQAEIENNILNLDFYYGDTLLSSSSQEASQEILTAAQTYDLQQRQSQQAADSQPASTETEKDSSSSSSTVNHNSLDGFFQEALSVFQGLPSWKYPALGLLAGAFIFYIVLLIIKIRRAFSSKKHKKSRKKKKS